MRGKGKPVPIAASGVQVVEAPNAYSTAQAAKSNLPWKRTRKVLSTDGTTPEGRGSDGNGGRKRPRSPSYEQEYAQIWKSVTDLGAEQFTGKKKREYEKNKILEIGGKAPKQKKMPFVMLQGLRKKAKQREKRREALEAEADIVTGSFKLGRKSGGKMQRAHAGLAGTGKGGNRQGSRLANVAETGFLFAETERSSSSVPNNGGYPGPVDISFIRF
ncbi:unnamed protein product [Discosporangium mesarthrocarpum]